ncbi:MAG: hypothetical protein LUG18_07720 [Candidatus Azobacteroides sp.]|nr:hypothetical protein [Candidatus Azobacteroides sp.]
MKKNKNNIFIQKIFLFIFTLFFANILTATLTEVMAAKEIKTPFYVDSENYPVSESVFPDHREYEKISGEKFLSPSVFSENQSSEILKDNEQKVALTDITDGELEIGGVERAVSVKEDYFVFAFLIIGYIGFRRKKIKAELLDHT